VLGTGLLKPNISAIVGDLYPEGGARRDAGFSIFYMGINMGAFFGQLITGYLGEQVGWHWGFGAAGVGMLIGLITFVTLSKSTLGDIGLEPSSHPDPAIDAKQKRTVKTVLGAGLVLLAEQQRIYLVHSYRLIGSGNDALQGFNPIIRCGRRIDPQP